MSTSPVNGDDIPVSKIEQLEYKARTGARGVLGDLPKCFFRYIRYSRPLKIGLLRNIIEFPRFFKHLLEMESNWQLLMFVTSRAVRNLKSMVVAYARRMTIMSYKSVSTILQNDRPGSDALKQRIS